MMKADLQNLGVNEDPDAQKAVTDYLSAYVNPLVSLYTFEQNIVNPAHQVMQYTNLGNKMTGTIPTTSLNQSRKQSIDLQV